MFICRCLLMPKEKQFFCFTSYFNFVVDKTSYSHDVWLPGILLAKALV